MSGHLKGVINIGIFKRKKKIEKRAESPSVLTLEGLVAYGTKITREQALEIPTVAACVGKLADTVARLPIHLHQKVEDKVVEVKGDLRLKQLNGETGDAMNAVEMWTAALSDYFLGRGAWIYIEPQFEGLHYVDSRSVGIISNADPIFKQFCVNINGQNYYDWQFIKLLRKTRNGWDNVPIQEESATIFSAAYNSIKLENQMNVNGGCKPGFLKSSHILTKESADMIRENYNSMFSNDGGSQKGKVVVLNEGIDFQAVTNTAVELQMNENKKVNSIEICKLFGFPHTIIDGGASEEDKKQFISVVVSIVNRIETALDTVMLYEDEKEKGYYWSFDTRELTRGNMKERYEAYAIALENHFLQIDEVRREEDYEPVGFNFVTMGLGDILLNPETMEVFTPNTGQTSNLLTGESRAEGIELRYNHNHDSKGRFASGSGGGGIANMTKLYSNGGEKPKEGVDKSFESGISGKSTSSTGENTVDLKYINSDEYKQKFNGITGNTKVDKQLHSQAIAQLTHRNGTYGEDLTLINAETGNIEGRQSKSLTENGVDYNKSLNKALADNSPYSLISIHNHPTNNPPTGSDLASNGSKKYKLGVVVTHNGRVFTYKAGNKPFLAHSFDNVVDKNRSKGYNEYEAIIETLKQYQHDYGIEWSER